LKQLFHDINSQKFLYLLYHGYSLLARKTLVVKKSNWLESMPSVWIVKRIAVTWSGTAILLLSEQMF